MQRRLIVPSFLPSLCIAAALLGMFALLRPSPEASEERALAPHVPGELLIKFREEALDSDRLAARDLVVATRRHTFDSGAEHWRLGAAIDVATALTALSDNSLIEYAEPNALGEFLKTPSDEKYGPNQWAPPLIDAELAWNRTTGSQSVVVAVLDSGIDFSHPDLAPNKWSNAGEVAGNGLDDDNNGYVDDKDGWDFEDDNNDPFPHESPHGTFIAGIIGADAVELQFGPAFGMAGLNWDVRLMNLKVGGRTLATEAAVINAVDYARKNGANIINASFKFDCDVPPCNQALKAAIKLAGDHDVLLVAAAGNDGLNIDAPGNSVNPASFDLLNVITVAATDPNDQWAVFAPSGETNFGPISVDLGAPGEDIYSADKVVGDPNNSFYTASGTSFAAPHVVGVAALLKSISPNIPFELLRARLLDPSNLDPTTDPDPADLHPTVTGGRLNAYEPINDEETVAPSPVSNVWATNAGRTTLTLKWYATGDNGATGNASLHKARHSLSPITESNWVQAKLSGTVSTIVSPGTLLSVPVTGLAPGTAYYFKVKGYDEWGNGPISTNTGTIYTCSSVCAISWCQSIAFRCNYTGVCPGGTCCQYQCVEDESCLQADQCPSSACSCY